jgi:hypothetical protein
VVQFQVHRLMGDRYCQLHRVVAQTGYNHLRLQEHLCPEDQDYRRSVRSVNAQNTLFGDFAGSSKPER